MAFEWLSDLGDFALKGIKSIDAGDVLNAGVNIGGALLSNNATNDAIDTQTAAGKEALALQEKMYNQSREDLAPYRASGNAANAKLSNLMGLAMPFDGAAYRTKLLADHPLLFGGNAPAAAAGNSGTGVFPQTNSDATRLRRALATDPNDMSPAAQEKRRQLHNAETALSNFKDGDINPTTGEKFDRQRYIDFMTNEADYNVANPHNSLGFQPMTDEDRAPITGERESLYRQTYIPSKSKNSFLGKYGAPLALAALTGGIGALAPASALAGVGSTSLSGANIAKNALGFSSMLGKKS